MTKPLQLLTLDFETYYAKDFTLKKLTSEEYIRDERFEVIGVGLKFNDTPAQWYDARAHDLHRVLRSIDWRHTVVLGHNMSGFDSFILTERFRVRPRGYLCTVAMARALRGGRVANSLARLAEEYGLPAKGTEVEDALGKHLLDFTDEELAAYGEYCKNDCEITYQLYQILKGKLPAKEQQLVHLFTKMFAEPRLHLDREMLFKYKLMVGADKEEKLAKAGMPLSDLRSDAKFAEALKRLNVDPPLKISKRTGKQAYAFAKTDKGLTDLLDHYDPRVVDLVSARLGVKTSIEESRVARFLGIAERGPSLPVPLLYGSTLTHRVSGGGKINLQNLGRKSPLRRAIIAPPGKRIVVADSSNIELRVAHTLSGQMDTVARLRNDDDLYAAFATELYGYPVTKESHPKERQHGKVAMLQLQYQSGAVSFRNAARIIGGIELTEEESQATVDVFRAKFPCIKQMWGLCLMAIDSMYRGVSTAIDEWGLCTVLKDKLMLPNGMTLDYANLRQEPDPQFGKQWMYDDKGEWKPKKLYGGALLENICQALARIVVFDQMLEVEKKYGGYDDAGNGVVFTVHDEIVVVVDEEKAEECLAFALDVMHQSPKWWPELPVAAEGSTATNYGDAK